MITNFCKIKRVNLINYWHLTISNLRLKSLIVINSKNLVIQNLQICTYLLFFIYTIKSIFVSSTVFLMQFIVLNFKKSENFKYKY